MVPQPERQYTLQKDDVDALGRVSSTTRRHEVKGEMSTFSGHIVSAWMPCNRDGFDEPFDARQPAVPVRGAHSCGCSDEPGACVKILVCVSTVDADVLPSIGDQGR
jgi:hypothetical protein